MESPPLAKIEIITDGGPWAMHNFPCPVCGVNKAILNLNEGTFEPCGDCIAKNWQLVQWRHKRWSYLTRWLRKGWR
jgi:hypothetical protein